MPSLSLTFHRQKSTFSRYLGWAWRRTLSKSLHGPHHGAKASTNTGRSGESAGRRRMWRLSSSMVSMDSFFLASGTSSAFVSVANSFEVDATLTWGLVIDDEKGVVSTAMNAVTDTLLVVVVIAATMANVVAIVGRALLLLRLGCIAGWGDDGFMKTRVAA